MILMNESDGDAAIRKHRRAFMRVLEESVRYAAIGGCTGFTIPKVQFKIQVLNDPDKNMLEVSSGWIR